MHDVTKLRRTTGGFLPYSQVGLPTGAIEVATPPVARAGRS
jgi:hypothetical protein